LKPKPMLGRAKMVDAMAHSSSKCTFKCTWGNGVAIEAMAKVHEYINFQQIPRPP